MNYLKIVSCSLLIASGLTHADDTENVDNNEDVSPTFEEQCYSENTEVGALDKTYHYLNTKFCQPAIWFDSFFVDERITDDARAGTMVRWYNDFAWSESEGYHYKTYLKAKLHLPKASRKLKLVFESDADDLLDMFPSDGDDLESSLGLRYDWYAREKSSFNVKVSLKPSIEARYRYSYPLSQDTLLQFTQRVYRRKGVLGERSQIDLDHTLNQDFLVRWASYAKYDDDINSFELGSGLTLYQAVSSKQALSYQLSMRGFEEPKTHVSNTHVSITYRHNIYRDWLFYEIKPEYNWDKWFDDGAYGEEQLDEATITFRLEFLFNNI